MISVNYISNGKWYIRDKNDIRRVHDLLLGFYNDTLRSRYGESEVCRFIYDSDLQEVTLKKYGKKRHFNKSIKILLNNSLMLKRIKLLLESIASTGIVNAPFYLVDITFCIGGDTDEKSYLKSASKFGVGDGYFSLVGRIG